MSVPRQIATVIVSVALTTLACVGRPRTTPSSTGRTQVALLPDPDTGAVGRATVATQPGSVELSTARATSVAVRKSPPSGVTTLTEADARQLFGSALDMLPMAPQRFTLNFEFDSDELTAESRALVPQVLTAVKGRPVPEVDVIGHTDTMGTSASNIALGFKRAEIIRRLLIETGLDPSLIETSSHGEADLLVRTADEVPEPRNRRVEITVR